MDDALFKQWRELCDAKHGQKCCMQRNINLGVSPSWLIDVFEMRLVSGEGHVKDYMALSYVWGKIEMLKTTKENLTFLQESVSLVRLRAQIPWTIRNAIHVARKSEIKYLWVDSLCIVQDDEANLHHQLRIMASIYENASVTIIAADGENANSGIRGIRHGAYSLPRKSLPFFDLPDYISITFSGDQAGLDNSTWAKRAWTLQEFIFSPRKLIFYQGTLHSTVALQNMSVPRTGYQPVSAILESPLSGASLEVVLGQRFGIRLRSTITDT
ncbi:heterokaryon incompatibility protein-domain-containing protein [Sordaria brevicollis]|uniref:Heterokaryon incompatibility protein-domain-containing protein n=1 Tax=Sordaria brevicollis TaxID=83679 RepID=A0AAE0NW54_SORBR|nr:heterokaryon incompatibility protein-domain-containing protein [Sordaria brevicollis]